MTSIRFINEVTYGLLVVPDSGLILHLIEDCDLVS